MNVISKPQLMEITTGPLPASRKIYIAGDRHPELRVPMREISVHETAAEPPLVVYDTSGPYSDPATEIDLEAGLFRLREPWIQDRGDVENYAGRVVKLEDNGGATGAKLAPEFPRVHSPKRGKAGTNVTQMHYARSGMVTPEMEFIAIRENLRREHDPVASKKLIEAAESFGAEIPEYVTPEFVRDEVAAGRMGIPANRIHLS